MDAALLSRALVVWTGYGVVSWPSRDDDRLSRMFGAELASVVLRRIYELEEEFYTSDARHKAADLREMGNLASAQFRMRHPELSDEAVDALAWCYTFDYK